MNATCPECAQPNPVADEQQWSVLACAHCHAPFRARPDAALRLAERRQAQLARPDFSGARRIVVVEDVRSQHNVGAIFRTADGLGWTHICLTGITPTPPAKGLIKTALGAHEFVPWSYWARPTDALAALREQNVPLFALDNVSGARELRPEAPAGPIALMVGNELWGLSPESLRRAATIVALPMRGQKRSYNLSVAFGIAAYCLGS